jgi:hypothetical protein
MKNSTCSILTLVLLILTAIPAKAQKKPTGIEAIKSTDLEAHLSFIASPLLKGRVNGEPGLDIAQEYIVSQVKLLGLKPADGASYYQPYTVTRSEYDTALTLIQVAQEGKDSVIINRPFYQLLPTGPSNINIDGEVVFAGYGLKQDEYNYNDFENINPEGKILLIMSGAPLSDDGKTYRFREMNRGSFNSVQVKLLACMFTRAKAVLIFPDPKSGCSSLDEEMPEIYTSLKRTYEMKGEKTPDIQMPGMPRIIFVHRDAADELLRGTGHTLEGLQQEIDAGLKPHSFVIPGKILRIKGRVKTTDTRLNNVAAIIEGRDPALKNEYVVFTSHADHVGGSGADDNASGCAALLSIAKAFRLQEEKNSRSVLFLWFSGEETGLYGSKYYVSNPLVPLEKTVVALNMDMIGRVKGVADTSKDNPMTGKNAVFGITDYQSKDLLSIAGEVDRESVLDIDYSLSARNHPLVLYARSDHYNFTRKDIPVIFFTTGLHTDYHKPTDVVEKIDFRKLELVTRTMYQIGFTVANRKERISVDNPFSKW